MAMTLFCSTRSVAIGLAVCAWLAASVAAPSREVLADAGAGVIEADTRTGVMAPVPHEDAIGRRVSDSLGRTGDRAAASKAPQYASLDQAWQAIQSDWAHLGASTSADWRVARNGAEQDWTAITTELQRLVGE